MKKTLYRIVSMIMVAMFFLTTSDIEVLATVSTGNVVANKEIAGVEEKSEVWDKTVSSGEVPSTKQAVEIGELTVNQFNAAGNVLGASAYKTPKKAKKISLNKDYSFNVQPNEVLWLKVPVKSLIKNKTHITVETTGVSNKISAFYDVKTAEKGNTDVSYLSVSSPLSYPLAWKGDYYYIKIVAEATGTITCKVKSTKKEPTVPVYEDDFCTNEALAMTEYSILPLLSGMRNVRDNLLTNSDFGSELSDYYYSVSKNIATDLVSDESFRATLATNVKELIPLMNELILLSEGEASSYVFTQSDLEAMISIKESVAPRLSAKDRVLGEKLWEQFHFEQYVGKSLAELVEVELIYSQYNAAAELGYSEYIVSYSGDESISNVLEKANEKLEQDGINVKLSVRETENLFGNSHKYIIEVEGCSNEDIIAEILEKSNYFDEVSVNYQVSLLTKDVQYQYEWHLQNKGQKIPSRKSNGDMQYVAGKKNSDIKYTDMTKYLKGKKQSKVVVAVIDTGINYNLADFAGRVDTKNAYNYVKNNKDAMDDNNHGTHVSGIIAANANNNYSMAGIDANVTILPIKVLDADGSGNADNLAKAIKYAADHGANIINLSLGIRKSNGDPVMPESCEEVEKAMKYAVEEKNITIIAAAGNESKNNLSYPANSKYTISVGAIDNKDKLASFTNTGKGLDLVAPGVSIPSLVKSGEVAFLSGTSMAAPVVTAVVSTMYSLDTTLNSAKTLKILKKTSRDLGTKGYDKKFGYGCVDANKAVRNVSIKVTSLKISAKSKTLNAGDKTTLKVTVLPKYAANKKLKWTSSNSKVATVDNKGNVTAVAPGTATIKATAADGSNKKVECKVTVK